MLAPFPVLLVMRCCALMLALLLAGCATDSGPRFDRQGVRAIDPAQAVDGPEVLAGEAVIWGGVIAGVQAREDGGRAIEILHYPLTPAQRPDMAADPGRRFIAQHAGDLDRERYARQRRITVVGRLDGVQRGQVGDYAYSYPLVRITDHELWPEQAVGAPRRRGGLRLGIGLGVRIGID